MKNLYQRIAEQNRAREETDRYKIFHLSTNMCPAHRLDVLARIRKALENQEKVICISTQLIEAGINISFNNVFRILAGLDSIAQAAGRCNRHGKDNIPGGGLYC